VVLICFALSYPRDLPLISLTLQVLEHQSTDGHDSEHRVFAPGTVSWKVGDVFALV
jgi:hypothetical protein